MEDYIVMCDMDGVIANINHRLRYQREKNYKTFYSDEKLAQDTPFHMGINILESLQSSKNCFKTYIVTGRSSDCLEATKWWLDRNFIDYDEILMRNAGDYRPSATVKSEMVKKILEENSQYDMHYYFLDDDPSNVKRVENINPMYILGITVGTGLFHKLETPISVDERSALMHAKKLITNAIEPLDRVLGKGTDGKISGIHD